MKDKTEGYFIVTSIVLFFGSLWGGFYLYNIVDDWARAPLVISVIAFMLLGVACFVAAVAYKPEDEQ